MALSTDGMKSAIKAAFSGMTGTGNNSLFANGIANGCLAAVSTAQVATETNAQVGADTSPTGTFTGTAQGTMVVVPSGCASAILAACNAMDVNGGGGEGEGEGEPAEGEEEEVDKDDDYLAGEIAKAIDTMCSAATFVITISGSTVTTTTPPQTITTSDAGVGTFSSDPSGIESDLKSVFADMRDVDDKGNPAATEDDMIDTLCSAFEDYLKNAQVSIIGQTHLAGTSGMGSIS